MARRVHEFTTSKYGGRATITGYRDANGAWNQLNPRTGGWYTGTGKPGGGDRHHGRPPTDAELKDGRDFGIHVQYRHPQRQPDGKYRIVETEYWYTLHSPVGISGRRVEADFRARIKAGYFRRHGTRR